MNYTDIIKTKTVKTAQKVLNTDGPGGIMLSVIPEDKSCLRLIIGARAIDNTSPYVGKKSLKELAEFLLELSETLE
jgi:hypothetical protein